MENVLSERHEQLKTIHQADFERLKDEHEKNMKNLAQELQDIVRPVYCLYVAVFVFLHCHLSAVSVVNDGTFCQLYQSFCHHIFILQKSRLLVLIISY